MLLGISSKAPKREKIKSDYESLIRGFNMTGDIEYSVYSQLFDWGMPLFDAMYEQGKKDAINWHKYPEEKPTRTDNYVITVKRGRKLYTDVSCYDVSERDFEIEFDTKVIVIAWADRPEPYKEETEDADSD